MCSGCDAYALAIVVWELVTLLRPFSDTPEQVLSGAVGWGAQRPPLAPLDEAVAEQHGEVASAVRCVGVCLAAAVGPQLSESSVQSLHEVFGALTNRQVLFALFGNALKPHAGIACSACLRELLVASEQWLSSAPAAVDDIVR